MAALDVLINAARLWRNKPMGWANDYETTEGHLRRAIDEYDLEQKKKAEAVKPRPCDHSTCDYEVGGRWSCEYPPI